MPLAIEKRPAAQDAIAVIHAALDAGMTWVDTADSYCLDENDIGYCERLVKRAFDSWKGPREKILVTTKGGWVRPGGGWEMNCSPAHLRAACEASLKALGIERHTLYQLHAADPKVYFPDSVGALADLQREGKIQHIGLCNIDAGHLKDARKIVDVATVQNRCNAVERYNYGNGVIALCEQQNIAFIAHSPVGGHQGRARIGNHPVLEAIARRHGAAAQEIALAWLLESSPKLFAIPGATKVATVTSSVRAPEITLTLQDRAELDDAFPMPSFLVKQLVRVRRKARQLVRQARRLF